MFTQDSWSTHSSFQKELQMLLTAELMKISRRSIEPSRKQAQAVLPAAAWKWWKFQ